MVGPAPYPLERDAMDNVPPEGIAPTRCGLTLPSGYCLDRPDGEESMYHPISSYALIGNMRTAALVGPNGSIDWLCMPRFDSPSIFGALLDDRIGGQFSIYPTHNSLQVSRFYLPDTNVLVSRYRQGESVAEVIDFMPLPVRGREGERPFVVRLVRAEHGELQFSMRCAPAFDYARGKHRVEVTEGAARFLHEHACLTLGTTVPVRVEHDEVHSEFIVSPGRDAVFTLNYLDGEGVPPAPADPLTAGEMLQDTSAYWRRWLGRCTYHGRWEERVHRSALALKLLTYEPTGAIVAAPTTSLPEHIGGSRNWDYRYTWLRDAAFTVYAFLRVGFTEEAIGFMNWLQQRSHELEPNGMLRPLYTVDGGREPPEEELLHLDGYRGSRPVRIGNAASAQLQLDVPGAVMDAAYLHNKYATPLSYDMWLELEKLLNWVVHNWRKPDEGIWEVRGGRRHFTFSKLMCWVALDRGLRLAQSRSFPGAHEQWMSARDDIYREIMSRGWDPQQQSFMQAYDSPTLDASLLIMPLVFFISPNDPRFLKTVEALRRPLSEGGLVNDLLVYRYNFQETDDGLAQPEGGFNMCTFWLIEALTRAGHANREYLELARVLFDRLLLSSGDFGLYAEQTSDDGQALGNYPQAFTHLAFISTAYNLNRTLKGYSPE